MTVVQMNKLLNSSQPTNSKLIKDEVHIWLASLDRPAREFQSMLTVDEQERAARFKFERDSHRFIVRRGILRKLLSYCTGIELGKIRLSYGQNGKPRLADELNREGIHFNLSHSEALAVYAFTLNREIGVDIERIRSIKDMTRLAERFFSYRENMTLSKLSESQKKAGFFNCWTRKEAFIKATGDGLAMPLDKFDVSLAPGEPAGLLRIDGDASKASEWDIQDLNVSPGFTAAFAVKGRAGNVKCRQWAG